MLIRVLLIAIAAAFTVLGPMAPQAQTPPSEAEVRAYTGLHAAAAKGDTVAIEKLIAEGAVPDSRDSNRRTPLHVAAFRHHGAAVRALVRHGADPNALDAQAYDIVTIAAVANDVSMLKTALANGASARNVTSPYQGTALIAAAHLGHAEIVRLLAAANAPLDHINNLGWTALIEAIVLGDGGANHTATVAALVQAGANVNLPDRNKSTPLALARGRGYAEIVKILEAAGAR